MVQVCHLKVILRYRYIVMCMAQLQALSQAGLSFLGPGPGGTQRWMTKGLGRAQKRSKPEPAAQAAAERLSATCLTCQLLATFSLPLTPRRSPLAPHSLPPSQPPAQDIYKQITNPPTFTASHLLHQQPQKHPFNTPARLLTTDLDANLCTLASPQQPAKPSTTSTKTQDNLSLLTFAH